MNLLDLRLPFGADAIEWRIGRSGVKQDGSVWALVVAYVTNRAIMDRLDAVCGPENWRNRFERAPEGGVVCGLSIRVGDEWIEKWDGAENTDIESVKGGLSNAMKRAAVQWGIGRYLYGLEEGFARVHEGGKHRAKAKAKDGKDVAFRWDPPALPAWALPPASRLVPASAPSAPVSASRLVDLVRDSAESESLDARAVWVALQRILRPTFGEQKLTELQGEELGIAIEHIHMAIAEAKAQEAPVESI